MNLKLQKPNRRVFYFAITIVVTILLIIYFNENPQLFQKKEVMEKTFVSLEIESESISSIDSDGDGLYDWEEILRGTDPNNPDTDGDGTSDGDEVALGRDPLIPGPDDKNSNKIKVDSLDLGIETDPDSFSSQVGQNILMSILEKRNDPNSILDPDSLITELENEASVLVNYKNKYKIENLIILSNDKKDIEKYYNEFIPVLVAGFAELLLLDVKTPTDMQEKIPPVYDELSEKLFLISVPKELSNIHLQLINTIDSISFYSKLILNENNDPILAYYAFPEFNKATTNLEQLYTQLINYPEKNGIIFEEGEPAYAFFNETES